MNAVGAIGKLITDDAGTVALLPTNSSVYPVIIPQGKPYPAVTLTISSTKPNDSKTQISPIDNVIVSVKIFAKTYDKTQQIDTEIRRVIDGFDGTVTTTDAVVHKFDEIRFLTREDGYDEENRLFVRMANYDVRYYRQ